MTGATAGTGMEAATGEAATGEAATRVVPVARADEGGGAEPTAGAARGGRVPYVPGFARWPVAGSPKAEGKALRTRVPRSAHATLGLDAARPDAVSAVEESSRGRIPGLAPIRAGRMAAT
ncbi:DUF2252 domain-containing protein, partial [Streptomyces violaceoruber]